MCDGQNDCSDGSDEENCKEYICDEDQFKCKTSGICIGMTTIRTKRCDGKRHCPDGSDEENCEGYTCPEDMFQCKVGGKCIHDFQRYVHCEHCSLSNIRLQSYFNLPFLFVLDVTMTETVLMVLMKKIVKLVHLKKIITKQNFVKQTKDVLNSKIYVLE